MLAPMSSGVAGGGANRRRVRGGWSRHDRCRLRGRRPVHRRAPGSPGHARSAAGSSLPGASRREPHQLNLPLDHGSSWPVMLSFGDVRQFAGRIRAAGVPLICRSAGRTRPAGADQGLQVLVAQGGGRRPRHRLRSTLTLVPRSDLVREQSDPVQCSAAGGGGRPRARGRAGTRRRRGGRQTRFAATAEATNLRGRARADDPGQGDDTLATRV
ncbi:hypothetical protein HBB16_09065 [Pseudonocardia sp. MCCB 268]|nr:hypothetical protein [Pseudonocardia cytotoxica]